MVFTTPRPMNADLLLAHFRTAVSVPGSIPGTFVLGDADRPSLETLNSWLAEAAETDDEREAVEEFGFNPLDLDLEMHTLLGWAVDSSGPVSTANGIDAIRFGDEWIVTYSNDSDGDVYLLACVVAPLEDVADPLLADLACDVASDYYMPAVPDEIGWSRHVANDTVRDIVRAWAEGVMDYFGWEDTAIGAPRPEDEAAADAVFDAYWQRVGVDE